MTDEAQNLPASSQGAGAYASLFGMSFIAGSVFLFNELALQAFPPAVLVLAACQTVCGQFGSGNQKQSCHPTVLPCKATVSP